jgi:hypothetical protein
LGKGRHRGAGSRSTSGRIVALFVWLALLMLLSAVQANQQARAGGTQAASSQASPNDSGRLRGTKLMLKDGTYQLVREYKVEGDRVRYYSLDRSQWEEIPSALVDWDQTKKVEAQQAQSDSALLSKVHGQEEARRVAPLDIDASLEVAPNVFLPPGEGVFLFDNKAVLAVPPEEPSYRTDKKRQIEKVLSPIPIVSSRQFVLITGEHAKLRIKTGQPEFYMRTKQDADPELQLVPARIRDGDRQVARLDELFKEQQTTVQPLLLQRWQIAHGVYRFTIGQTLKPGEYALVQVIQGKTDLDQVSIHLWDFGVDPRPAAALKTQ